MLMLVAAGAATVLGGGLAETHVALSAERPSGIKRLLDYRGADFLPQRAAFMDWPASRTIPCDLRIQTLAAAALTDLGRVLRRLDAAWLATHGYQLAVVLPEPGIMTADGLMPVVANATRVLGMAPSDVKAHACGAAGLAAALSDHISTGQRTALLVVAADSFANEARLNMLNDAGRLFNKRNVWGLVPGEAGAALLFIPDAQDETQLALTVLGASVAVEVVGEDDPESSGYQGLTAACQSAARQADAQIVAWDTDCNNARYRAAEFSYTALRLGPKLDRDCAIRHLATNMGDTGAASSTLALGLWWQDPDRPAEPILVTGTGQTTRMRGAIMLGQTVGQSQHVSHPDQK